MNRKELVMKYRGLVSLACRTHNLRNLFRIKKTGSGNRIIAPCALLKKVDIRIKDNDEPARFDAEIARLTAKARAAGIHVILATQRPDTKFECHKQ